MGIILRFSLLGALTVIAALGCSQENKPDIYQSSPLEDLPFVYKMTVQQGNIITEEMVDGLEPGMNKRQVRFLLGTPLLTDFFHPNRWDYTYTIQRGHQAMEIRNLTLYFEGDNLSRIEGDMRPDPKREEAREPKEIVVSVPDYQERQGLIKRSLEATGVEAKD